MVFSRFKDIFNGGIQHIDTQIDERQNSVTYSSKQENATRQGQEENYTWGQGNSRLQP